MEDGKNIHCSNDTIAMIQTVINQLRVLYALLMRELQTRYGSRKLGFVWQILEVLANVAIFAMLKYLLDIQHPQGLNMILFLTSGIIPFLYFSNVATKFLSTIDANRALLIIPNVKLLDFYYARWLLESVASIIILCLGFYLAIVFVENNNHYYLVDYQVNDYGLIMQGLALIGFIAFGYGILTTAIVSIFPGLKLLIAVIKKVLYFTSGVIFALEIVPYRYHDLLSWNPVVHCMAIIRQGFFYDYHTYDYFNDINYVIIFGFVMLASGLLLFFQAQRWLFK